MNVMACLCCGLTLQLEQQLLLHDLLVNIIIQYVLQNLAWTLAWTVWVLETTSSARLYDTVLKQCLAFHSCLLCMKKTCRCHQQVLLLIITRKVIPRYDQILRHSILHKQVVSQHVQYLLQKSTRSTWALRLPPPRTATRLSSSRMGIAAGSCG